MNTIIGEYYYSGIKDELIVKENNIAVFSKLESFLKKHPLETKLIFISYDIKNNIETLVSNNTDSVEFPTLHCIIPKQISSKNSFSCSNNKENPPFTFTPELNQKKYIDRINKIKEHIQNGDIYETNFCYSWMAKNQLTNSYRLFEKLDQLTEAPFSVYADLENHVVLCASPERFIKKIGGKLISQPIKGTAKKAHQTDLDNKIIQQLESDPKERAENIMIVDLVRNDLSKVATKNSVSVDELCKVYSFKNIHQMISTVSCSTNDDITFSKIIKALFPMGSMTGVPKIKAMDLMEEYETSKRGLYSGAIGVIQPDGDFDLNVVIRTLLYNKKNQTLTFSVGGAITIDSAPEKEYQETLIKADALIKACK